MPRNICLIFIIFFQLKINLQTEVELECRRIIGIITTTGAGSQAVHFEVGRVYTAEFGKCIKVLCGTIHTDAIQKPCLQREGIAKCDIVDFHIVTVLDGVVCQHIHTSSDVCVFAVRLFYQVALHGLQPEVKFVHIEELEAECATQRDGWITSLFLL